MGSELEVAGTVEPGIQLGRPPFCIILANVLLVTPESLWRFDRFACADPTPPSSPNHAVAPSPRAIRCRPPLRVPPVRIDERAPRLISSAFARKKSTYPVSAGDSPRHRCSSVTAAA
jgi:hypothetical protein